MTLCRIIVHNHVFCELVYYVTQMRTAKWHMACECKYNRPNFVSTLKCGKKTQWQLFSKCVVWDKFRWNWSCRFTHSSPTEACSVSSALILFTCPSGSSRTILVGYDLPSPRISANGIRFLFLRASFLIGSRVHFSPPPLFIIVHDEHVSTALHVPV